MILSDAIVEAKARQGVIEDAFDATEFQQGWAEGVHWLLWMLSECDDLEIEELA